MPQINFPEFRDEYRTTNYPFSDTASLTNAQGDFIGQGIFLDASFYPVGGAARLYLSQVDITNAQATLWLGDSRTAQLARAEFPLLAPPDQVSFVDDYARPAGLIVSSSLSLATFAAWSVGSHKFTPGQTEFVASVCMPTPETGVRGVLLDDGSLLTGDVWLVGDDGIVLTPTLARYQDGQGREQWQPAVRIDIVGDPLFRRRLCESPALFNTPRFIERVVVQQGLNTFVVTPDEYGNIALTTGGGAPDSVLRVVPGPQGLQVTAVGPGA